MKEQLEISIINEGMAIHGNVDMDHGGSILGLVNGNVVSSGACRRTFARPQMALPHSDSPTRLRRRSRARFLPTCARPLPPSSSTQHSSSAMLFCLSIARPSEFASYAVKTRSRARGHKFLRLPMACTTFRRS